jgi:hypothetical protein
MQEEFHRRYASIFEQINKVLQKDLVVYNTWNSSKEEPIQEFAEYVKTVEELSTRIMSKYQKVPEHTSYWLHNETLTRTMMCDNADRVAIFKLHKKDDMDCLTIQVLGEELNATLCACDKEVDFRYNLGPSNHLHMRLVSKI